MAEYVYLVREREFLRLNEPTFKVGKTKNEPNSRLGGYPKGSFCGWYFLSRLNAVTLKKSRLMN